MIERKTLIVISAAAILTRIISLFLMSGNLHTDSVFEVLEPAHKITYGYGILTWEYVYGIRSWFVPLLVAEVFRAGEMLKITQINDLIFAVKLLASAASLALLYVIYVFSKDLFGVRTAAYSTIFAVFSPLLWAWSAETHPMIISTLYSTISLYIFWLGASRKSARLYLLSGLSLGVSFMFRFDTIIFMLPLLIFAICSGQQRALSPFLMGVGVVLMLQGLLDYLTWGYFFHSPLESFTQQIVHGKASFFGVQPPYYFIGVLGLHITCLFMLPYAMEKNKATTFLAMNSIVILVMYSLIPHKEARFIMPMLPVFLILAGHGMEKAVDSLGSQFRYAILALTIISSTFITYDLVINSGQDKLAAMIYVGQQSDATGVAYNTPWGSSGGYTYLHKMIPAVYVSKTALGPALNTIKCGKPKMSLIGFQCSPWADIPSESKINYLMVDRSIPVQVPSSFVMVKEFNGVLVYKRI